MSMSDSLLQPIHPSLAPLAIKFPELYRTAFTQPAIDNHAHPLLRASARDSIPFEGLLSEAEGEALNDSIYTVSSRIAAKQLGNLFEIDLRDTEDERAKWEKLKQFRGGIDYDTLCRISFNAAGIHSILIDDGLGGGPGGMASLAEGYKWHDKLTALGRTKRIVRIEVEAEDVLRSLYVSSDLLPKLSTFESALREHLARLASHEDVVGFKSIVCYRTGLNVSLHSDEAEKVNALVSLQASFKEHNGRIRLAHKALNDEVVRIALSVAGEQNIPVQFHTGLGDTDIRLNLSSPAHMQPLIDTPGGSSFQVT